MKSLADLKARIDAANKRFAATTCQILQPGEYGFEVKEARFEHDAKRGYDYIFVLLLCNGETLTSDRFPMSDNLLWKISTLLKAVGIDIDSWIDEKELIGRQGVLTAGQKGTLVIYRYHPRES